MERVTPLPPVNLPAAPAPPRALRRPRRVGAFLSGGGFNGALQAGAVCALASAGIYPDVGVGISVGSLNLVLWMMRVTARLRLLWAEIDFTDIFAGETTLGKVYNFATRRGLYSNDPLARMIEREVDERRILGDYRTGFVDLETEEYIIASSRDPKYAGKIGQAILASTTIPVQHTPVAMDYPVGSKTLVDGGVWNVSPIGHLLDVAGEIDLIVVINCSPEHKRPNERRRIRDGVQVAKSSISMMIDRSVVQDMKTFRLINTIAELNGGSFQLPNGKVYRHIPSIIVQPDEHLGSGMNADRPRLDALFEAGYREAEAQLEALKLLP